MTSTTAERTEIAADAFLDDADPVLIDGSSNLAIPAESSTTTKWFYGWVMLPLATLMMISTSPGQTFGVTYFNEKFLTEFNLSNTGLSAIYLAATLTAALSLTWIGALIDRFGLRRMVLVGFTSLAAACAFASQVTGVGTLFVAFLLLRMFGPGTMTLLANNTLASWFDRRLGLASSISQVTMAGAWALVPVGIVFLIDSFGWRGAYLAFAGILAGGLLPLMTVLYRQSPAEVGQIPDGHRFHDRTRYPSPVAGKQFTVNQAMRVPAYWILLAATATWSLVGTSLIFFLVSIFQSVGLDGKSSTQAVGCMALAMGLTQVTGGVLADRLAMRWLLVASMSLLAASCVAIGQAGDLWSLVAGFGVFGVAQGLMTIISSTSWARYFGRAHLGKIRGTSLTAAVGASAIGPVIMGTSVDYLGGFMPSLWLYAAVTGMLAVAGWWATPPRSVED